MASEYIIDDLDRITAILEHLHDATEVYFDRQKAWTPRDMESLIDALSRAQVQLRDVSYTQSRRAIYQTLSPRVE